MRSWTNSQHSVSGCMTGYHSWGATLQGLTADGRWENMPAVPSEGRHTQNDTPTGWERRGVSEHAEAPGVPRSVWGRYTAYRVHTLGPERHSGDRYLGRVNEVSPATPITPRDRGMSLTRFLAMEATVNSVAGTRAMKALGVTDDVRNWKSICQWVARHPEAKGESRSHPAHRNKRPQGLDPIHGWVSLPARYKAEARKDLLRSFRKARAYNPAITIVGFLPCWDYPSQPKVTVKSPSGQGASLSGVCSWGYPSGAQVQVWKEA